MKTKRTHTCGELNSSNDCNEVILNGWVDSVRLYGALAFIDLRDRYGITQIVFDESEDSGLLERAKGLHLEYCIAVIGHVRFRAEGQKNADRATGEIEVLASDFHIFSKTRSHPFVVGDSEAPGEDVRMKYRFIDLRRAEMQEALGFRSKVTYAIHHFMNSEGFWDIDTPILAKSTPEGARDYLVPSRVNQGRFYALPQSPQQFKQLLMIGGCDKYYQIAKCFRDEDLRADRQPEFSQIDVEMSFADREEVFSMSERMMKAIFASTLNVDLPTPFPRITFAQAVENYASDKPDLRFSLTVATLNDLVADSEFKVFSSVVKNGGSVRGIAAPGISKWSRKMMKSLETVCTSSGAKGMAWLKYTSDDKFEGPIAKFFPPEKALPLARAMNASVGDVLCFVADSKQTANACMHNLRNHLGRELKLFDPKETNFLWVVDFPLFSWNEDEKRYDSEHHPFTAPIPQDMSAFDGDLGDIPSASYDLVYNGSEIASGSQRIHDPEVQKKVFEVLKMSSEMILERFGFFIDALDYGTPPHAGIAFGLDRIITLMLNRDSIRDVIAFPKNAQATDLMTEAPSAVDKLQLDDLGISLSK